MEDYLRIIGDGLSIAALAIIFSTSWKAQPRIKPDAQVPMTFDRMGEPALRKGRMTALWTMPFVSLALLLVPTLSMATFTMTGQEAIMMLCLRAMVSSALAMRHIVHMHRTMQLLEREGQLLS